MQPLTGARALSELLWDNSRAEAIDWRLGWLTANSQMLTSCPCSIPRCFLPQCRWTDAPCFSKDLGKTEKAFPGLEAHFQSGALYFAGSGGLFSVHISDTHSKQLMAGRESIDQLPEIRKYSNTDGADTGFVKIIKKGFFCVCSHLIRILTRVRLSTQQ